MVNKKKMIISIIGGIGSGKTLSAVKEIIDYQNFPITNFRLKTINYHRLKYPDIIETKDKKLTVNWKFWESIRKNHNFYSIFLDEAHNIINARTSMSKNNIILSRWISQIRKILSDHPRNHIYIITQKPRKIDVNFRDLTQVVIECEKLEQNNKVYIIQRYYEGFDNYYLNRLKAKLIYRAEKYFQFFNTNEMVKFSDADEYV